MRPVRGPNLRGYIALFSSYGRTTRANPGAATMWAFSTCLCMSCSLSEPGGAGLGTLGFTVPVARRMLGALDGAGDDLRG